MNRSHLQVAVWLLGLAAAASPAAADPSAARITVLYDAFGQPSELTKDWGFAALIEYGDTRILFDTGNDPEVFASNANAAGVDLTDIDIAVVSHRHADHTGGLAHLVAVNEHVPIYAPKENFGVFGATLPGDFYPADESLPADLRYFDGNPPTSLAFPGAWPDANISWVAETTEIAPGIHIVALRGDWGVDLDVIELSLAIETPDGVVLIVGCGHPTIERIVAETASRIDSNIHTVIGGLHLLPASPDEVRRIATTLRDDWNIARIAPAHCTGEHALAIIRRVFGERFVPAGLGEVLALPAPEPEDIAAATPGEAIAKVREAVELLAEQGQDAIPQIADPNGPFVWKDSYVFVVACDADRVIANPLFPERVGGDIKQHTDYAGYRYGIALCEAAATKPSGSWIDYVWIRPGTGKPADKSSYVMAVPGKSYQVGAGVYGRLSKPDRHRNSH